LRANTIPGNSGFALTSVPILSDVVPGGGSLAQIASGGGWQTTFTLVNTGPATTVQLNFFDDNGTPVSLPLRFPQNGMTATTSEVRQTIPAGGSLIIEAQGSGGATAVVGSAVLATTGNVGGFAVFRYNASGQESVTPLQVANASSYVLAFDNTGNLSTGLALANVAPEAASVKVVIRDETGAEIGTPVLELSARGHKAFMLTDTSAGGWAITAGMRGIIEFHTPVRGHIAPLGLRFAALPEGFTMTSIPVMEH
jgi:hypothetical protein